ncbi:unnamed protein product [Paramecium pentaurelia]|uniref:Lipoyl-binding domain-containing protein n=1 Tax=Paramecium pentaurelia TaxID=43138 RepID=A0A8S1W4D3_9CILI|nr:unnamed protein product [Paramecium pentaurelia]
MRQFAISLFKVSQTQFAQIPKFYFSKKVVNVPTMGDSITEGDVKELQKKVGDYVNQDDVIALIETDKVTIDIRCADSGIITQMFAADGAKVEVGKPFYEIDTSAAKPAGATGTPETKKEQKQEVKQEVKQEQKQEAPAAQKSTPPPAAKPAEKKPVAPSVTTPTQRTEKREPMSRMRQRIAQRLKDAQNTYALLTTFQECDMSAVMEAREAMQKDFQKKHNVKLGFSSFFIKAAVKQLQEQPIVNAVIDGTDIVYRNYIDISMAVATPTGLMVPVLRNCERLSFADIERTLIDLAEKGRQGKISADDMVGGTFTISNGGVFGSLMGTPIINAPQSAILGMHAIVNRPVVRNDQIVARPMMYLALTYDHRILDGKDAATFLKRLSTSIEDPRRILLDV